MKFGKSIVTDGLIFYLDAANTKSYVSGSTTCDDIFGSQVTGSLKNSIGFSTENKGTFTLDGVNDFIELPDSDIFSFGDGSNDSPFSVSVWVNITDATRFRILTKYATSKREWYFLSSTDNKWGLIIFDESASAYEGIISTGTLTSLHGKWINLAGTYDGRGGTSANDGLNIYINGSIQSVSKVDSGTYTAMENLTQPVYIGNFDNTTYANGKIAITQVYNKELTASELLQNYNALKSRFT